jgi:hypothetical protein
MGLVCIILRTVWFSHWLLIIVCISMGESTVRASLRLALEHMVEQGGGGYYQGPGSICEGLVGRFSDALDVYSE